MQTRPIIYGVLLSVVIAAGILIAQPTATPSRESAAPAVPAAPTAVSAAEPMSAKPISTATEPVVSASPAAIDFSEAVETAFLSAQRVAVLSAEVSGIVEKIGFEQGQFVQQGDVLIQLNTDLISLRVQRLQNQLELDTGRQEARITGEYRTRNLEITQKLYDTMMNSVRVGSPKELEEAKQLKELADLAGSKAELNVRLLNLELKENQKLYDRHSIKAPFDGVIVPFSSVVHLKNQEFKKFEIGEAVQPGQQVIALMKVDRLRVQWSLPISMLDQVHLGQKAKVVIQSPAESSVEAEVIYKSPTVEITGQFNIEVEFANPLLKPAESAKGFYIYQYRPGMRARVELK